MPTSSLSGTSAATPFVTGAAALLWSQWPDAPPTLIRTALLQPCTPRGRSIIPPLLNAWAAYEYLHQCRIGQQVC